MCSVAADEEVIEERVSCWRACDICATEVMGRRYAVRQSVVINDESSVLAL